MKLARSGWHLALLLATAGMVTSGNGGGQRRGGNERRRKLHRVQNGQCSYTFILPEMEGCQGGGDHVAGSNVVQRDAPPGESEWSAQKLQHLEMAMENNTQWLQKMLEDLIMLMKLVVNTEVMTQLLVEEDIDVGFD
ncbi:Angiopoietin-1 [Triplophysa tibetana]|uniref:Angiopoietin-1 n=1 Tax=Triplophysa tibetana TaxID=1572043 RepID=A0A5A9NV97_9TELE|nr:Angiopoietin-1 [Triplophysa tibetana]